MGKKFFWLFALVGVVYAGQAKESATQPMLSDFDRGCYTTFGADPRTQVVVHWGTADDEPSAVAYGLTVDMPDTVRGGETANHHILLSGLIPGQTYYYSIVGKPYSGEFHTAPDGYESFKFVVFGDNRSNHEDHQAVVDAICSEPDVRFVLNVGDMVSNGGSTDDWEMFFNIESELLARHIMMPTRGNHDWSYYPWDDDPMEMLFNYQSYGSFDYSDVHFVWLNTEDDLDDQRIWLISDLSGARADPDIHWIVVWLHRPPFSTGEHGDNEDVRDAFVDVFKRFGVNFVFCGHDHDYERTLPVGGTYYVVTGGGGAPLYDVGVGANTAFSLRTLEYCLVEVDSFRMTLVVKNPAGEVVDSVSVNRGPHIIRPDLPVPALTCPPDSFLVVFESQIPPEMIRFGIVAPDSSSSRVLSWGAVSADSSNEYTTFYSVWCYLPYTVDPGLYDFFIETSSGLLDYAYNAVMVYPEYKDTFSFIHITDTHYGSGAEHTNNLVHALEICDILNPEFVLITGDITDNGKRREYYEFLPLLRKMHIPVFLVPGNHDHYQEWEGIDTYRDIVSPILDYSFDYGNHHFVMVNTGPDDGFPYYHCYGLTDEQLSWLEYDLSAADAAETKIIGLHGPVFDELTPNEHGMDQLVGMCVAHRVNLVLAGHTHYNKVFTADGERHSSGNWSYPPEPLFVQTASCAKNETFTPRTDFRYIFIMGDSIPPITVDDDGDGNPEAETAWDIWRITYNYEYSADSMSAMFVISNQHYNSFPHCRVYFAMKPGVSYVASGGEVVYSGADGSIAVEFDLPARSVDTITISFDTLAVALGGKDRVARSIETVPNPFNGLCRIRAPEGFEVEILSLDGRIVAGFDRNEVIWRPGDEVPGGVYLVRAKSSDGTVLRGKILYLK